MHEFTINSNYKSKEEAVLDAINHFETKGEYVVKGKRNSIKKFKIDDLELNIKSFKSPNTFNSIVYKYFRPSKAKRSYDYANLLINSGIKTPFPIAYYESKSPTGLKQSYYVSEHINYDFDFRVLIHQQQFPNRKVILEQFTEFTFRLHQVGIDFLDHSPGNTLIVKKGEDNYNFYLIDLNRMRFKTMNFDNRMFNFRRLWLSKGMINIMSKKYAELYGKSFEETHSLMTKYSRAFQLKVNSKKIRKRRRH